MGGWNVTREERIAGLIKIAGFFEARADMAVGDAKLLLTHWAGCAETAARELTAQAPRVMTLEEAKSAFVVEYRSGEMREVGSALLDLNVDPLNAEYGKIYRVWTSRPTDAQREATSWRDS